MKVTFALYDGVTALDLVGPYQVLSAVPQAEIRLAAVQAGELRTDSGMRISADYALADLDASAVIIVPGTGQLKHALSNRALIGWLTEQGPRASWLGSVCTGSLLLGAAGLLRGKRATTHWLVLPMLSEFGATPVESRVVFDGTLVTGAGVSAGIDMALSLVERIWGSEAAQIAQLAIEYDPDPPCAAGSPRTASPAVVAAATQRVIAASDMEGP